MTGPAGQVILRPRTRRQNSNLDRRVTRARQTGATSSAVRTDQQLPQYLANNVAPDEINHAAITASNTASVINHNQPTSTIPNNQAGEGAGSSASGQQPSELVEEEQGAGSQGEEEAVPATASGSIVSEEEGEGEEDQTEVEARGGQGRTGAGTDAEATDDGHTRSGHVFVPPVLVPYRLEQKKPDFNEVKAALRMPAYLAVKPKSGVDELPEELRDYKESFSNASKSAKSIYEQVKRIASRQLQKASMQSSKLAGIRQRNFDRSMMALAWDFERSVFALSSAEAGATESLNRMAKQTRKSIHAAGAIARGVITLRRTALEIELADFRTRETAVTARVGGYVSSLQSGARDARAQMLALKADPSSMYFDQPGRWPQKMAFKNELLSKVIPDVAEIRADFFRDEGASQVERMQQTQTNVGTALTNGFASFDRILETLAPTPDADPESNVGSAVRAINQMEQRAIDGCDEAQKKILSAIKKVRKEGEKSLVAQYQNSRQAIAESSQDVADREIAAEEKAVNGTVMGYDGLAFAQGIAISGLHDEIGNQVNLPAEEFAKFVIQSGANAENEAEKRSGKQLEKLKKTSKKTVESMDQQTGASQHALEKTTRSSGGVLMKSSQGVATSLHQQVTATQENFAKMPDPVIKILEKFELPAGQEMEDLKTALEDMVAYAELLATASYNGTPPPEPPEVPNAEESTGEPETTPAELTRKPVEFVADSATASDTPESDDKIQKKKTEANSAANMDVQQRAGKMNGQMTLTGQSPEATVDIVRGITNQQGWALREAYNARRSPDTLWNDIPYYISFGNPLTWPATRVYYGRAVQNYLVGNSERGLLYELEGATTLWDDEAQVDKALAGNDAETVAGLSNYPGAEEILADVRDDLGATSQLVFDRYLEGDAQGARALRLEEAVQAARNVRGDAGADKAYDQMSSFYSQMGMTRLEGNDPYNVMGSSLRPDDAPTPEAMEQQRQEQWEDLVSRVGNEGRRREGEDALAAGQEALLNLATQERIYYDHSAGADFEGNYRHDGRLVREGVSVDQERLLNAAVMSGPRSARARAAQLMVEENRAGGPKRERVENAMDFSGLNEGLANPDAPPPPPTTEPPPESFARRQQREMLEAYGDFHAEANPGEPRPSVEQIREQMGNRLAEAAGDDENLANLMRARATRDPHDPRVAALAVRDAVERGGTLEEEIKRQFGRMSRDQIEEAASIYREEFGEDMYERLGLFEHQDSWSPSELSGDDANEIQVAAMGVPRNDREAFEVARMRSKVDIDDSTAVGRWLAGDESEHMLAEYDRLLAIGGKDLEFDNRGNIVGHRRGVAIGHFDAQGNFSPPSGSQWESDALALSIESNRMAVDQYKAATDAIANMITTSIVIAAAVASTALTGGAAASIWIPVLVTAGAGLAGMAVNYAIKGGRYGYEDMARDFAMTIVQSATAGVGAAAGVYLAGGKTALQAVSSRMMVADDALNAFLQAGGKGGMKALTLGDELLIGGITGIMGGAGNALMDERAWDRGEWGSEFGHHLAKGMLGGVIGAGANRTGLRMAGASQGSAGANSASRQLVGRTIGGGLGGFASSLAEAGYDQNRGRSRGSFNQIMDQAMQAGAQGTLQSLLEAGAEQGADRPVRNNPNSRLARLRRRLQDTQVGFGQRGTRTGADGAPPSRRRGELPPGAVDAETMNAIRADRELSDSLDAILLGDQLGMPLDPAMVPDALRPIVELLIDMPASRRGDPETDVRTDAGDADPAAGEPSFGMSDSDITRGRSVIDAPADDDVRMVMRTIGGDDSESDAPSVRHLDPDDTPTGEYPAYKPDDLLTNLSDPDAVPQRIFPDTDLTPEALKDLPSVPEHAEIFATDRSSERAARANYDELRRNDPHREVLIAYHPGRKEWKVIQGGSHSVDSPGRGWQTKRHSHPRLAGGDTAEALVRSMPSATGGDFAVLKGEFDHLVSTGRIKADEPMESHIDTRINEQDGVTTFSIRKVNGEYELRVTFRPPSEGHEALGPFKSIAEYEDKALQLTGVDFSNPNSKTVLTPDAPRPRPRAERGAALTPDLRQDAIFISRHMAAGDTDVEITAAIHQRIDDMGLIDQPDSMIRLYNILNDTSIDPDVKANVARAVVDATTTKLRESGDLRAGDELLMLFHGVPVDQAASYERSGMDMSLVHRDSAGAKKRADARGAPADPNEVRQGLRVREDGARSAETTGRGSDDDAGFGLYGSQDLPSAAGYTNDIGPVIPLLIRRSELGNVIDVRPGTPLGDRWEAFVRATLNDFGGPQMLSGREYLREHSLFPGMSMPIGVEGGARGRRYIAFLDSLVADASLPPAIRAAAADPHITLMDLGGIATWGNDQGMVTDQFAIHNQRVADLFNQAMGYPRIGTDNDGQQMRAVETDPKRAVGDNEGGLDTIETEIDAVESSPASKTDETALPSGKGESEVTAVRNQQFEAAWQVISAKSIRLRESIERAQLNFGYDDFVSYVMASDPVERIAIRDAISQKLRAANVDEAEFVRAIRALITFENRVGTAIRNQVAFTTDRTSRPIPKVSEAMTEIVRESPSARVIASEFPEFFGRLETDFLKSKNHQSAKDFEQFLTRSLAGRDENLPHNKDLLAVRKAVAKTRVRVGQFHTALSDAIELMRGQGHLGPDLAKVDVLHDPPTDFSGLESIDASTELVPGTRIEHPIFGRGTVYEQDGSTIRVQFEGRKGRIDGWKDGADGTAMLDLAEGNIFPAGARHDVETETVVPFRSKAERDERQQQIDQIRADERIPEYKDEKSPGTIALASGGDELAVGSSSKTSARLYNLSADDRRDLMTGFRRMGITNDATQSPARFVHHAELASLFNLRQALRARGRDMPPIVELFVDRELCSSCGLNLHLVAEYLGIRELRVYYRDRNSNIPVIYKGR